MTSSINPLSNIYDLSGLGINSLFTSSNSQTSFPQGTSNDPDFAKLLLAQIQNESLKIMGNSGDDTSSNSESDSTGLESYLTSLNSSAAGRPQTGSDILNSLFSSDNSDSIFSDQMLSIMRMNQIQVFQALVGKKVRAKTSDGQAVEGVVEGVVWQNNQFVLSVGGQQVLPESVQEVLS